MPVDRAVRAYQLERLNCAQSVLRAFQGAEPEGGSELRAASMLGHGRAEGGLCGALHMAQALAADAAARGRISAGFVAAAGAVRCREIRRLGRIPCVECVRLAARLLVEQRAPATGAEVAEPVMEEVSYE